jgi:hypothetical protein
MQGNFGHGCEEKFLLLFPGSSQAVISLANYLQRIYVGSTNVAEEGHETHTL